MKYRTHYLFLSIFFLAGMLPAQQLPAAGSNSAELELILVEASNDGGGVGAALKPYSKNLTRIFNFDSFRLIQKTSLRFDAEDSKTAKLNGQTVKINTTGIHSKRLEAQLNWNNRKRTVLRTQLKLKKAVPAVLGGPRTKSGNATYLILLTWKR